MRPSAGHVLGGRYELSHRIAIGGMGEVWQATDTVIGRIVAIKILKDEYTGDPGFLERFRAEARHAALVNHEGIANVYDYGEEDASAYLVMELVPGEALSAMIERDRSLPVDRVLDIVAQTAAALHAAHSAGLVHRDIKPGNLLITPDGRVKITDFGIARIADQVPLTATGQVMGTVQYLSPEQASGKPASPATDIYSLGIVAYEALAGKRPFTGESQVAIAMAQINEAPPALPASIPEPVRNLVFACIAKNPKDRPATAQHLARAAQLLRRGDVPAAAAAVPGILSPGVIAAVGSAAPPAAPTVVIPAGPGTSTKPTPVVVGRRPSPWLWPLVGVISVLALALIGIVVAILVNGGRGDISPTPSGSTSNPPASSPAPSGSPTPTMVALDKASLVGKTVEQVQAILTDLGLRLDPRQGDPAPTPEQVGLAYEVDPWGNVRAGITVTVWFYSDHVPPTPILGTPQLPTAATAPPYAAGSTVHVTWPAYGCPAEHPLGGYTVTVTATGSDPVVTGPISATSIDVVLGSDSGHQTSVSYVAHCGAFTSPSSQPLTLTVE